MTRDQRMRERVVCQWKSLGQYVCREPATSDGLCLRHSLKRANRNATDLPPRPQKRDNDE